MNKALDRYNDLMMDLCREHNTIGMRLSENTEKWNLRDMVSEVQYCLDTWKDESCIYYQDSHAPWSYGEEREINYRMWKSEIGRMERFINRYKDEALKLECSEGHCSKFD